ncbi:sensor histidine kinase [Flavobacterium sp. RHBU_24]|uniref:sensor histidine kinase n=1 Tax=Flavobacterium sp. RHBU_24 TaxID=3391185 RepID=UPI003984770E
MEPKNTSENTAFLTQQRYLKMIEEVQDYAIILLDKDGNIQNWNRGAEKIKGYTEKEITGKNFRIFYLPEDREAQLPQRLITEAATTGRAAHEGWRMRKDGTAFWGNVVITALHDENKNIIGFTKVTRDLTERKIAEDQKERDAKSIAMQNRQLEEFAYITSHDLQEPIRKIQTFINLIKRDIGNRENLELYLPKISASASRMVTLIKDVLNFSRLSELPEQFSAVALNEVIHDVIIDFEVLIAEKNATITAGTLPVVQGIPVQLAQLFSNLLGNALKFTTGKPVITVNSSLVNDSNNHSPLENLQYYSISVKDNGIGFDQQYADQAFQPFRRLTTEFSGTGIGLALCKRIVENHKGSISVVSTPGQGTEFTILLPATPANPIKNI